MKKKIIGLLFLGLAITGCGKIPTLKNGEEAVVSFENGDMISVNELYEEIKNTYGLNSLITLVDTYTLEKTFKDHIETAKEYAESYVKAVRSNYDSDEEFLSALQQYMGMATIEDYQKYMYLSYMQSHAVETYAKDQITDKDIEKYYKNEVVGDIEVSHILITPDVTDKMTDDEQKTAEKEAKTKAENVIATLKKTDKADIATKFAELAKDYSTDSATKDKGGALGKINKNTLTSEYDELVDAAYSLKDGAYSTKVITTELGYHVILRTKSYDKASLEDSKEDIIQALADELFEEDPTLAIDALQHYRKKLGMEIHDSELQTQFAYYVQNQLLSAEK